jgi:hypothetical protein
VERGNILQSWFENTNMTELRKRWLSPVNKL